MQLAVIGQKQDEQRVALVPELVEKFTALGLSVGIEHGAGLAAGFTDDAYAQAGARLDSAQALLVDASIILTVRPPSPALIQAMQKGAILVGALEPYGDRALLEIYASAGLSAFAMELMPRISRAQSMDVLSSQSNLAGYKAVIDGVALFNRAVPMMMTAAGTIAPARVFVMGAGVAGLQAIATAKRLGAIVSATDVRASAKEQVESLGAQFVMVKDEETQQAETAGGYAREMSQDYQRRQQALIEETITKQDMVICTALIPGRKAPILVRAEMVRSMKRGSIIVDLAVEQGGNCELSKADQVVQVHGVKIAGWTNMAGRLAQDASKLYGRNLLHFVSLMIDKDSQSININWEDEIFAKTALIKEGQICERNSA